MLAENYVKSTHFKLLNNKASIDPLESVWQSLPAYCDDLYSLLVEFEIKKLLGAYNRPSSNELTLRKQGLGSNWYRVKMVKSWLWKQATNISQPSKIN